MGTIEKNDCSFVDHITLVQNASLTKVKPMERIQCQKSYQNVSKVISDFITLHL
jgi:hypothetical protein